MKPKRKPRRLKRAERKALNQGTILLEESKPIDDDLTLDEISQLDSMRIDLDLHKYIHAEEDTDTPYNSKSLRGHV